MRELSLEIHDSRTCSDSLDELGWRGLVERVRIECGAWQPELGTGRDPREDLPVVWSEARARRLAVPDDVCVVCDVQTCVAVDRQGRADGDESWLTPNLYPILYPFEDPRRNEAQGVHLVQWSARRHDGGLPGASRDTACAIFEQLARAESWLLHHAPRSYPSTGMGHRGHVGLIKNRGRKVGGSVAHDHQQVLLGALPFAEPRRTKGLGDELMRRTPRSLMVENVDGLATTLVPSFMRRPLHAFVVPHAPTTVGWLHHLADDLRDALAVAVARLTAAVDDLMAEDGGEPAWNLVFHTGSGCDPLIELRPYTQPLGGFEHLGLYACEETPATSAARLRGAVRGG